MLSPFPGMDPYLENPNRWRGFHTRFIVALSEQLAERVGPNFYVEIPERVDIIELGSRTGKYILPDAYIVSTPTDPFGIQQADAIAPATLIEPFLVEETSERFLEIIEKESREIVTVIEVLSPTNKARNSEGLDAFMEKRRTIMSSQTHWMEIDLLRAGERPAAVAGKSDYYALLARAREKKQHTPYEVWFFNLRDRMPTIAVPLQPAFDDVPLNLQMAFDVTYQRARYPSILEYTHEPPAPPLRNEDAQWVQERVREWKKAVNG